MKRLPIHRRIWSILHPFAKQRVLEIGGGHDPYGGVTHALDKFPHDNSQRAGDLVLGKGIEFFQGDLEDIPFRSDHKFDFTYISHVFEHVLDPKKAIGEINRVCTRGYLETPSPIREQIASLPEFRAFYGASPDQENFHHFFCWGSGSVLRVIPKTEATLWKYCGCRDGLVARELVGRAAWRADLEILLPRMAKTTKLYFKAPIQLVVYPDFESACRDGYCAYSSSIGSARFWASWPLRLLSKRFGTLRSLLANIEQTAGEHG